MPLHLSTRSLQTPADLAGRLEIFRMATVRRVAVEDDLLAGPDERARLAPFTLLAHGVFLPDTERFGPNLAAGDEDYRKRSVRRLEAHLDFCADRGVARYTFMPGEALMETYDPLTPSHPCDRLKARDQLLKSLDRLAEVADRRGVALGLMNGDARRAEQLGCEAAELAGILETLQIPFLGLRLDVAHLGLAAVARVFSPEEFIARLGDRLIGLRLHAVNRAGQSHQLPAPEGGAEELLCGHPEWHGLPMSLDARGVGLDRLLDTAERIESLLAPPLLGPART